MTHARRSGTDWPDLPWRSSSPTVTTVHHWLQVVGRVRMVLTPRQPHWGHAPLEVTPRGLTTGPVPFGSRAFAIDLDFVEHRLEIIEDGAVASVLPLAPMSVARFYRELMTGLDDLGADSDGARGKPDGHAARPSRGASAVRPGPRAPHVAGFRIAERALQVFRRAAGGTWTAPRLFWDSLDLATSRYDGLTATANPVDGRELVRGLGGHALVGRQTLHQLSYSRSGGRQRLSQRGA